MRKLVQTKVFFQNAAAGSSLVSALMGMFITGIVSLIFINQSQSSKILMDGQKNLEMRSELLASLRRVARVAECGPVFLENTQGPVTLYRDGSSVIDVDGSTMGRFSFVADMDPSDEVVLRAAAFKHPTEMPRSHLQSDKDKFVKIGTTVWDFDYVDSILGEYAPTLKIVCGADTNSEFIKSLDYHCAGRGSTGSGKNMGCSFMHVDTGCTCTASDSESVEVNGNGSGKKMLNPNACRNQIRQCVKKKEAAASGSTSTAGRTSKKK